MYLGKPGIVSNVTGNKDVVYNIINGYLAIELYDYIKSIKHYIRF